MDKISSVSPDIPVEKTTSKKPASPLVSAVPQIRVKITDSIETSLSASTYGSSWKHAPDNGSLGHWFDSVA